MSKEFDDWVGLDMKELSNLAEDFKNKAKLYGNVVQEKFSELPKVKHIFEKFEFFVRHDLHDHLKEQFEEVKKFIETQDKCTEDIKLEESSDDMIKCM